MAPAAPRMPLAPPRAAHAMKDRRPTHTRGRERAASEDNGGGADRTQKINISPHESCLAKDRQIASTTNVWIGVRLCIFCCLSPPIQSNICQAWEFNQCTVRLVSSVCGKQPAAYGFCCRQHKLKRTGTPRAGKRNRGRPLIRWTDT